MEAYLLSGHQLVQYGAHLFQNKYPQKSYNTERLALYFFASNIALLAWGSHQLLQQALNGKKIIALSAVLGGIGFFSSLRKGEARPPSEFDISLGHIRTEEDENVKEVIYKSSLNYQTFVPLSQSCARALYLAQLTQAIGLLFYQKAHWTHPLLTLGICYHALRTRWVELSYQEPIETIFTSTPDPLHQQRWMFPTTYEATLKPTFAWTLTLDPAYFSFFTQKCVICMDHFADSYYCENRHRFCSQCLIQSHEQRIKKFAADRLKNESYPIEASFHYSSILLLTTHNRTTYALSGINREEAFPNCPECRSVPPDTTIHFKEGTVKKCNLPPPPHFWDLAPFVALCYCVYSLAHYHFACKQVSHPTLSRFNQAIYLLPLDLVAIGLLNQKEAVHNGMQPSIFDVSSRTKAIAAVTMMAILVFTLYRRNTANNDLSSLLSGKVAPENLKDLKITTSLPSKQHLLEGVLGAKFLITLAVASRSRNRALLLCAAFINALTLRQWMKGQWLRFQRTYDVSFSRYASTATPSFQFLVPYSIDPDQNTPSLRALVESIYDHTTHLFKESSWWATRYIGERTYLVYEATILPQKWLHRGIDLFEYLFSKGGTAYSSWNGLGSLLLKTKS